MSYSDKQSVFARLFIIFLVNKLQLVFKNLIIQNPAFQKTGFTTHHE